MKGKPTAAEVKAGLRKFYDIAWVLADAMRKLGAIAKREIPAFAKNKAVCWIHACSLGETAVALRLIAQLRRLDPNTAFVLSAATREGLALASTSEAEIVMRFPPDSPVAMKRIFDRLNPNFIMLVEAEIWPNHLRQARERNVPVFLVNGRMTQNEFRRYKMVQALMSEAFSTLTMVFAQTADDARRFRELGARNVIVTGNMKSDPSPGFAQQLPPGCLWLEEYTGPAVLAASTHRGEEKILLEWLAQTKSRTNPVLILAPRHVTRVRKIVDQARRLGFRADAASSSSGTRDVVVVDSVGKMQTFYKIATVCFVGKSLCARGGQNPWEPLQSGCPVIFGPHMENFTEGAGEILRCGAALQVSNGRELSATIEDLIADEETQKTMADAGVALLAGRPPVTEMVASQTLQCLASAARRRVYPSAAPC